MIPAPAVRQCAGSDERVPNNLPPPEQVYDTPMASKQNGLGQQGPSLTEPGVRCLAGVLVGGTSTRMGRPKALLAMPDGLTLVEHVAGVVQGLGPAVEETVILGRFDALPSSLSHLRILPDAAVDAGPLAGLVSLLDQAAGRWAMLLSCDMPLVDAPVLRRLLAEAHAEVDAVAFLRSGRPRTYHACCALYHPRVISTAEQQLKEGKRSLQRLLANVRTTALIPSARENRQLINVNTPAEHVRALRLL